MAAVLRRDGRAKGVTGKAGESQALDHSKPCQASRFVGPPPWPALLPQTKVMPQHSLTAAPASRLRARRPGCPRSLRPAGMQRARRRGLTLRRLRPQHNSRRC